MTATETDRIPVGVIGVGSMGQQHVRVYESLPGANLIGIVDESTKRANDIAAKYGTKTYELEALLDCVAAVTIAVPTEYHFELTMMCLNAGVDVLIEKPIAASVSEAQKLVQSATAHEQLLQVGHIERFNPAIETLQQFVDDLNIVSLDAERLGPPPTRQINDSAVMDLMIHDIDIVLSLLGEMPQTVSGAGVRENRHTTATLMFPSETIATLTASRLTQKKVRTLTIVAESCAIQLDYISKDIEIHRQSCPEYITDDTNIRYQHESLVERPAVDSAEPLANELSAFLKSIRKQTSPVVDGKDGLRALQIAEQIDQSQVDNSGRTANQPIATDIDSEVQPD